jgi:hypothetical protein
LGSFKPETVNHTKNDSFVLKPAPVIEVQAQAPPVKSYYNYNAIIGGNIPSENSSAEGRPQNIMDRRSSLNRRVAETAYGMVRLTPKL